MSLDISLTAKVETTVVNKNITHNLGKMWKEAGVYDALYNSKGKMAKEVLPTLENGLQEMIAEPERFKQFEASNGWGMYEDAVSWLSDLIVQFKQYPEGIIDIWK